MLIGATAMLLGGGPVDCRSAAGCCSTTSAGADDVSSEIGWWDERTGARRWGDGGSGTSIDRAVIAADGAVATAYSRLNDDGDFERGFVGYLCAGRKRPGTMRRLARVEGLDRQSLAVGAKTVRRRTRTGAPGSAARDDLGCR